MNRRALILTLILSAMLALAACTTADDDATDDALDEEPTPTEAVTTDDTAVQDDDTAATDDDTATTDMDMNDDADPAADNDDFSDIDDQESLEEAIEEDRIRLDPPDGYLHVDDEEHEGVWAAYFWIHDPTGLAAEVSPPYFDFDEVEPAQVTSGDEIEFSFDFDDYDPEQMSVKVYDLDDADEPEGNRMLISWDPIEEHELEEGEFTWTADLDAGEYIIVVNTIWPTDMDAWHREQEVDYRWWVEVE